jgi:hypothetical protein
MAEMRSLGAEHFTASSHGGGGGKNMYANARSLGENLRERIGSCTVCFEVSFVKDFQCIDLVQHKECRALHTPPRRRFALLDSRHELPQDCRKVGCGPFARPGCPNRRLKKMCGTTASP